MLQSLGAGQPHGHSLTVRIGEVRHSDDEGVHLFRLGFCDLAEQFLLFERRRVVHHTRREVSRASEEVGASVDELQGCRHLGRLEGHRVGLVVERQARRERDCPDLQRGAHPTKYLSDGIDGDGHGDGHGGRSILGAGAGHLEGNSRFVRFGQPLNQRLNLRSLSPLRLLLGLGLGLERGRGDSLASRGHLLLGQRDERLARREHSTVARVHVPLKRELLVSLHVDEGDDGHPDAELASHRTEQLAHLLGRLDRGCADRAAVRHGNGLDVRDAAAQSSDHESLGARRVVAGENAAERLGPSRSVTWSVTWSVSELTGATPSLRWGSGRSLRGGSGRRLEGTRGARPRGRLGSDGFGRDASARGWAPDHEGLGHLGDHRGGYR